MIGFGGKGLGSECGIDELIGLLDDEEKLILEVGDGCSYTLFDSTGLLVLCRLCRSSICARLCCEAVVSL